MGIAFTAYALYLKFGDDFFISIVRKSKPWDFDNILLFGSVMIATGGFMRIMGIYKMQRRVILWVRIASVKLSYRYNQEELKCDCELG